MLSDPIGKHKLTYFNFLKWRGTINMLVQREGPKSRKLIEQHLLKNLSIEINLAMDKMIKNGEMTANGAVKLDDGTKLEEGENENTNS